MCRLRGSGAVGECGCYQGDWEVLRTNFWDDVPCFVFMNDKNIGNGIGHWL